MSAHWRSGPLRGFPAEAPSNGVSPGDKSPVKAGPFGGRPHVFDPSYSDPRRCVCSQQRRSPIHIKPEDACTP